MTPEPITPALTAAEWAEEVPDNLDERIRWACHEAGYNDSVSRHALAALALYSQPYGFTREDVELLQKTVYPLYALSGSVSGDAIIVVESNESRAVREAALLNLTSRIEALLPPETP